MRTGEVSIISHRDKHTTRVYDDFVLFFESLPFSSPFMFSCFIFHALQRYVFLFNYLLVLFVYYY